MDFTLPELGEQIEAGDVLRILVKAGETIAKDQPVLELETDKATIEVPSSVAGTIKEIKIKQGDKVKVGQAILSVDDAAADSDAAGKQEGSKAAGQERKAAGPEGRAEKAGGQEGKAARQEPKAAAADGKGARQEQSRPVADIGDENADLQPDVQVQDRSTRPDKAGVKDPTVGPDEGDDVRSDAGADASARPAPGDRKNVVDINRGARAAAEAATPEVPPAPAAPSVRRMARELGVDINEVPGSGDNGRISVDDVKAHAKRLVAGSRSGGGAAAGVPLPDFSRWGEVER